MWRVLRGGSTVQRPFAGKHVLITGGSEGLGLSLAKALAAQGAALTLVARTPAKLHSAREAAQAAAAAACSASPLLRPPHVYCHPADVTDYQQV
jgi:NAD(P)-dependent dehydrogenase (short-subunit alcohol dehydrogenase family)